MIVSQSAALRSGSLVFPDETIRPTARKVLVVARTTLRRTAAAFNMDHARFHLDVVRRSHINEVHLTYSPEDALPLSQRRDLWFTRQPDPIALAEVRKAVDEMVWYMALAFRPPQPSPPAGWSIHPAAVAIISAAGTRLPNPADPASWILDENRELRLPDGGNLVDVVFTGREGVLLLFSATIVNDRGVVVAILRTEDHRLLAAFPGAYPDTLVDALPGRRLGSVCAVFDADPRGAQAIIAAARSLPGSPACFTVEMVDRLVPLLASVPEKERWRPCNAKAVVPPPNRARSALLLGHIGRMTARYALRSATKRSPKIMDRPPTPDVSAWRFGL